LLAELVALRSLDWFDPPAQVIAVDGSVASDKLAEKIDRRSQRYHFDEFFNG
jgi:hypothetical protein